MFSHDLLLGVQDCWTIACLCYCPIGLMKELYHASSRCCDFIPPCCFEAVGVKRWPCSIPAVVLNLDPFQYSGPQRITSGESLQMGYVILEELGVNFLDTF